MKMKKLTLGLLTAALTLTLTSCGTTVMNNSKIYFNQTAAVAQNLLGSSAAKKETASAANSAAALAAPGDFSVDADGNYSFTGSEGAEYYLLYFCDSEATSDEDTFLYSSSPIEADGSETYSGKCADLFDYAYGDYLVKVYAFPDLTDDTHSMSTAATANYVYSGTQSAPQLYYCWDVFSNVMGVQVGNMGDYLYQAYPKRVDVTFTNVENGSDVVTVSIEDVSPDNYGIETDALTRGATYAVTAVATSESQFVTNPTSDVTTVSDGLTLGAHNLFTEGYYFSDGFNDELMYWPMLFENFDPVAGGLVGNAKSFGTRPMTFTATPTTASGDAKYAYDVLVDCWMPMNGKLELFHDGTFEISQEGVGPFQSSRIQGAWIENEDGTVTLSYDHSTVEFIV